MALPQKPSDAKEPLRPYGLLYIFQTLWGHENLKIISWWCQSLMLQELLKKDLRKTSDGEVYLAQHSKSFTMYLKMQAIIGKDVNGSQHISEAALQ